MGPLKAWTTPYEGSFTERKAKTAYDNATALGALATIYGFPKHISNSIDRHAAAASLAPVIGPMLNLVDSFYDVTKFVQKPNVSNAADIFLDYGGYKLSKAFTTSGLYSKDKGWLFETMTPEEVTGWKWSPIGMFDLLSDVSAHTK